ncbi:hypothetical protein BSKO_03347 [Bryopsis sp. KO-2023]|nr:hypothetical protein BSKO_03347 [Bryopsis sp. KO-2023]
MGSQTTNTQLQAPGAFPDSDDGVSLLDIISGRAGAPETEGDSQGDFDFPDGVTLELEGFTPLESLPPPGSGGPAGTQQGIPGDPAQGGVPGANIGPTNIQGGFQRGPPNIQGGFQRGPPNIQGGFQRGPPNIQGGLTNIQGGIRGNNTGVQTGPTFVGEQQPGSLPGPVSGAPGGVGTLPSGPEPQGGAPTGKRPNITAEIIEAPPEGEDAEFFGHVNADLCPCSDAVPSGAFNCMQVRFQDECELQSILKGPADVPEGFCEVTCGRCDCCTDMLTMSSRRGLDTFRKIFQTMADAEGSRSIARSLQNPSFATTVFAPTNDAFSRMLHLLNMTVDDFLEQPSLMNQVMTYHVLLGPTATSSEELSTGFLGTTLPTVNSAAFVSLNTSGPILGVDGIGSYANVLVPDVFSCKSIFHVVDEVLLPFSPKGFQGR